MLNSLGPLVVLGIVGQPTSSSCKGFLKHLKADGVFVCKGCLVVLYLVVSLRQHTKSLCFHWYSGACKTNLHAHAVAGTLLWLSMQLAAFSRYWYIKPMSKQQHHSTLMHTYIASITLGSVTSEC